MDGGRASRSWLDLEMGFLDQVTRTAEVRIEQEQKGGQGTSVFGWHSIISFPGVRCWVLSGTGVGVGGGGDSGECR